MPLPDSVYGSLATIAAMGAVWVAKAFVQQQFPKTLQSPPPPTLPQALPQQQQPVPEVFHLSARDWLNIMEAIEKQFNGRYWLAPEARAAMAELRVHSELQTEKLHDRISKLRDEIRDEIEEKVRELKH